MLKTATLALCLFACFTAKAQDLAEMQDEDAPVQKNEGRLSSVFEYLSIEEVIDAKV